MKNVEELKIFLIVAVLIFSNTWMGGSARGEEITFPIHSFIIEGNSVLNKERLTTSVKEFVGENKNAEDVESARDVLEKLYHQSGYPTVIVNIPEQTVDDGIVRLQVIESRIKRVRVVGNKFYTMEYINDYLSGIQPGEIIYLPKIREELAGINRNPDLKVAPILVPGREPGTIDVELKVEDQLPLHGSLEVNNRSTHTTTETRLNAMIRYDNLWQKAHSISAQFQTAPQDPDEVMVFSTSYSMPSFWNKKHLLVGYFINSDSETASGEGFNVIGKGKILGLRYLITLPYRMGYDHSLTMGFDWKDFEEDKLGEISPVEYLPFSLGYASSLLGKNSVLQFNAEINFLIRDLFINDIDDFQAKRYGSTGNYIYLVAGVEYNRHLPKDYSLFFKLDGQISDQPLISNEQFSAGGADNLRGFKESEISADNALHSTIELAGPSVLNEHPLRPYIFYDCAWLATREALPEEFGRTFLDSVGIGFTGIWNDQIEYRLDWGVALKGTDDTDSGDHSLHFRVSYRF